MDRRLSIGNGPTTRAREPRFRTNRSGSARRHAARAIFGVAIAVSVCTDLAMASPGDLLGQTTLPHGNIGVSVAADCNGNIYYTNGGEYTLYKTNKLGQDLSQIPTVDTDGAPIEMSELAWDPARQKLWAGARSASGSTVRVFLSDPVTGVATYEFDGPATGPGTGCCLVDGLAYDLSDDTIWLSPDQSTDVFHYSTLGVLLGTVTPKNATNQPLAKIAGIEVDGNGTLYVLRVTSEVVYMVNKVTGNWIGTLASSPSGEGLEIDRNSYAPKSVVWIREIGVIAATEIAPDGRSCEPTCPDTMVVHYAFDDPTDRGKDESGNNIEGVLGAATPVPGKCGTALRFRPNNNVQEFSVPSVPALNIIDEMTGSAWIKPRGTQSTDFNPGCTEGTIFAKGGSNWFQVERDNNRLVFQDEPSGNEVAIGNYAFPLNVWTQVGFVRTGKAGSVQTIQFYVNCEPIPTVVYENGVSTGTNVMQMPAYTNSDPLMVGNYGFGDSPAACEFNGDIDELKIFNRALTAAAVGAICSCPCPDTLQPCAVLDSLVINTGWDQLTANQIAEGLPDNDWIVVSDPDGATTEPRPSYVIPPYFGGSIWANPEPDSRWISSYPTSTDDLNGTYAFQYRFCLADAIGAYLDVCLRADDLADVYLNGTLLGSTGANSFRVSTPNCSGVTGSTPFVAGQNVLEVDVQNTSNVAMGLDLIGAVHGHVPQYARCCSDTTASLLGFVWRDDNANGVDEGTELRLSNWTVHLAGPKTLDAITDALGNYYFSGLPAGTYTVTQTPPSSWFASYPPALAPATVGSYTLILDNGEAVDQLNFGRFLPAAGVAGTTTSLRLAISQIRPNPLAERTTISFTTPTLSTVKFEVLDVSGRLVADLSPGMLAPGPHVLAWDGRAADGTRVRPGIYLVRLQAGSQHVTARLVLVY
jgi:Concanavalin A-like lectin/glucanases superfamily/SdrD B-like domain/FlgD Ig-like domain